MTVKRKKNTRLKSKLAKRNGSNFRTWRERVILLLYNTEWRWKPRIVSLHVFICLFNCFGHVGKFRTWWRGVVKIQSPIPRNVCVAGAGELRDYELKNAASSDPVSAPTKCINHPIPHPNLLISRISIHVPDRLFTSLSSCRVRRNPCVFFFFFSRGNGILSFCLNINVKGIWLGADWGIRTPVKDENLLWPLHFGECATATIGRNSSFCRLWPPLSNADTNPDIKISLSLGFWTAS